MIVESRTQEHLISPPWTRQRTSLCHLTAAAISCCFVFRSTDVFLQEEVLCIIQKVFKSATVRRGNSGTPGLYRQPRAGRDG